MLAQALPSILRRIRLELTETIESFLREAEVRESLHELRETTPPPQPDLAPSTADATPESAPLPSGLLERVREFLRRRLGHTTAEIDVTAFDLVAEQIERHEAELQRLLRERAEREHRFDEMEFEYAQLREDLDSRSREVADAEAENGQLKDEVRRLRQVAIDNGNAALAYAVEPNDEWRAPEDLTSLALTISPGPDSHPVTKHVEFHGDLDEIESLERQSSAHLYATRCWEFVRTLYDYAELASSDRFSGGMREYLLSDQHDGYKVAPKRHAANESASTMNQFGDERVFPVPTQVSPDGRVEMKAHFKIDQSNTVAPRLYYHDDVRGSGKIYIGYIGPHLRNTKTKNS